MKQEVYVKFAESLQCQQRGKLVRVKFAEALVKKAQAKTEPPPATPPPAPAPQPSPVQSIRAALQPYMNPTGVAGGLAMGLGSLATANAAFGNKSMLRRIIQAILGGTVAYGGYKYITDPNFHSTVNRHGANFVRSIGNGLEKLLYKKSSDLGTLVGGVAGAGIGGAGAYLASDLAGSDTRKRIRHAVLGALAGSAVGAYAGNKHGFNVGGDANKLQRVAISLDSGDKSLDGQRMREAFKRLAK